MRVGQPERAADQQQQRWTQALAARRNDVLADLPNQGNLAGQARRDDGIHLGHIVGNQGRDQVGGVVGVMQGSAVKGNAV